MINLDSYEIWFITGSQHLYGDKALEQVEAHAREVAASLNDCENIPVRIVFKSVLTTREAIRQIILEANAAASCTGLIAWMHTFSPAKMWIAGLKALQKPLLHLHTQFNRGIPWSSIDMDFMNLNQSAHGGREFGHMMSKMKVSRKVVVGHWQDGETLQKIAVWARASSAWHDAQGAAIARIGDNMREVAVTEGDKVAAEMKFGYAVNGYGVGDLVAFIDRVEDKNIDRLVEEYEDKYTVLPALAADGPKRTALRESARIEIGLKAFLENGGFKGFTDTFEELHGLKQLPGLPVQRLMAEGYGFGAEGDWKTAALVRAMKVMGHGLPGGNSFMEDYTYHFHPENAQVLGAHMLEICSTIARNKPSCEVHPLSIGGKEDPVRLVFDVAPGAALNASMIDLGHRFRLMANKVTAVAPENDLPKLPVARALWKPLPDLKTAATAWILAGGAHHTCYSQNLTTEYLEDFSEMAGIEFIKIDETTDLYHFKNELRWNEAAF